MAGKLELAVIAKNQASGVLRDVRGDVDKLGKAAGTSGGFLKNMFSVAGGNLLASAVRSATSAISSLGGAMAGVVAQSVKAAADMNAQISSIGAVSGASAEELVKIKQLITDLGIDPKLKVSASEAADAIEMLARNGLKLPEIMDGAARSTVLLANSTGADFSTAADVATDVMAQFGIKAADMSQAVNGITSVITNSKFDINDYRLAIAQAGGVAATVGVSFDDFNTTIAAISPLFGSGSDAGTSFKTFLQRLVPQSNEAAEAFQELGLYTFNTEKAMAELQRAGVQPVSKDMNSLVMQLGRVFAATHKVDLSTDKGIKAFNEWFMEIGAVQNAFFDANGQMKDMAEISGILNHRLSGLSEEQKIQTLSTLFGTDAMRAASGLMGITEEQFRSLQKTMATTNAEEAAAKRMDNLAGDMEIFSGVMETLRLQIGDKFQPALRKLFQGITPIVSKFVPQIADLTGYLADAFVVPTIDMFTNKLETLLGIMSQASTISGGLFAALGTLTGGSVSITAEGKVTSVKWGDFIGTLDWKNYVATLQWGDFIATFGWADWLTSLQWKNFIFAFDWSQWVGTFAWGDFISIVNWADWVYTLAWGDFLVNLDWKNLVFSLKWGDYVYTLDWKEFIAKLTRWGVYVSGIVWTEFVAKLNRWGIYVPSLTWAEFISGITLTDYVAVLNWGNFFAALDWKNYVFTLTWGDFVYQLDWGSWIASMSWGDFMSSADWGNWIFTLKWGDWVYTLNWSEYIAMLKRWGVYVSSLTWTDVIATFTEWSTYISKLTWTDIIVQLLDWATWVPALLWNEFVDAINWATYIFTLPWGDYVGQLYWFLYATTLDWGDYIASLPWIDWISKALDWADYITSLAWVDWITGALDWATYVASVTWANFIDKLTWPSFIESPAWKDFIDSLTWSSFVTSLTDWSVYVGSLLWGDWISSVLTWTSYVTSLPWSDWIAGILSLTDYVTSLDWTSFITGINLTDWVPTFPGWDYFFSWFTGGSGGHTANPSSRQSAVPAQQQQQGGGGWNLWSWLGLASGTDNWQGGWTWVGEKGPELLNLPRGSRVLSNKNSMKMIGNMAEGNTTAPAPNVFQAISAAATSLAQASGDMKKASKEMKDSVKDLESSLRNVPGLFGTSQVTDQQMRLAELGVPQNFADDWIRRLTDEVVNGVDWADVDIKDAARRAGIDPSLPAEAILELVKQQWNDRSFFANAENLDLINQDAVKAALEQQAKQKIGEKNILALFGVTPEQAQVAGTSTGTSAGVGMLTGITSTMADANAGTQIATSLGDGVTAGSMQPATAAVVDSFVIEMTKPQYSTQIGGALEKLFSQFLGRANAFSEVARKILTAIGNQFTKVTGIDLAARFTDAFRTQLGTENAIKSLNQVGAKILSTVYNGYVQAAKDKDWTAGVGGSGNSSSGGSSNNTSTGTTTNPPAAPSTPVTPGPTPPGSPLTPRSLLAAGAGGNVYITMNLNVADSLDIQQVAYKVVDIIRNRR